MFVLQVAHTIYTAYRTTEAATYAQHHNTGTAETFFGMLVLNVPSPSHACFPQSTPSHPDLDNGISFMSANDNDEVEDSNNNTGTSVPGAASDLTSKDVQPSLSPDDSKGDTLLYNNILLYRNILQLYEFNTSVHDGDIG